jgi:hypothetical protein
MSYVLSHGGIMTTKQESGPRMFDYHDPRHPLHCPDCDPGDEIGREHRRRMDRNWELLLYEEPRNTWPFDLVRLPNAIAICECRYHLALPDLGNPKRRDDDCMVCGEPAYYERYILWHTVSPTQWIRLYQYLRRRDTRCNVEGIIGELVKKPFCSRECYASAVLWALYLPTSTVQLGRISLLMPTWAIESARERRKSAERHREFQANMHASSVRVVSREEVDRRLDEALSMDLGTD